MPLQAKRTIERYSDFKINFDVHPVKKDLSLSTGPDAINRSIKNLLFTDRYERPWDPKKGGGLKAYLFENVNSLTATQIRQRIINTIDTYEPRAKLEEVVVAVHPDENRYTAKIVYSIRNNPDPVILNLILTRIR